MLPGRGGLSRFSCFYSRRWPTRPRIRKFSRRKRIKPARLSATKCFRASVERRTRDRKLLEGERNTACEKSRVQANDGDARNRIPSSFHRGLTKTSQVEVHCLASPSFDFRRGVSQLISWRVLPSADGNKSNCEQASAREVEKGRKRK